MRKFNPYFLFFILLLVPFSVYFVRPGIIGNDGYGFLVLSCMKDNVVGAEGLPFLLFSAFPCNIIAVKSVLFLLAFVSGCFVIKMATLFSERNGWRAAYLVFLSSAFVLEFSKFENDQFAFPFLFASLYFFFHSLKKNSRRSLAVSLLLLVPAGLLWQGAVFFPIAYTLNLWVLAVFSIPIVLFYGRELFGAVVRTSLVAENMSLQMHIHYILNLGLWGAILEPMLMPQALFFFALGALSAKFWILSLPFLVVGGVLLLERIDRKWVFDVSMIVAAITILALSQSVLLNPPDLNDWSAVTYAVAEANGEEIGSDWSYGYWIQFAGGRTSSFGSPHRQEEWKENQIVITTQKSDCTLLRKFRAISVLKC